MLSRAEPRPGANFRELATDIRSQLIASAQTRFFMKKRAVTVRSRAQHEKICSFTVRGDDSLFTQSLRKLFRRGFHFIDGSDAQADKIRSLHFNGHRATAAIASLTESLLVPNPCPWFVFVCFHHLPARFHSTSLDQNPVRCSTVTTFEQSNDFGRDRPYHFLL